MSYRLENWSFVTDNPFSAPELGRHMFHGFVYGHPKFDDGAEITTSYVVSQKNGIFKTQSGSEYVLGVVNPEYEVSFPDAYNRLLKQTGKE